jgi:hypothetical protein
LKKKGKITKAATKPKKEMKMSGGGGSKKTIKK